MEVENAPWKTTFLYTQGGCHFHVSELEYTFTIEASCFVESDRVVNRFVIERPLNVQCETIQILPGLPWTLS